ncbi:hypothetical protein [Nesterenkonia sp. HG001]|uniref:hypothetical protein n=1 Tax=Nesterenkonia sp. HG001 TaxID=2983207 RepID=UPI002AC44976|nr:hypothetical protein [Nesterenkonia sp. HG001]MDZ5076612.1 hypothetical protein [Nesterenkonia sp. HG001]
MKTPARLACTFAALGMMSSGIALSAPAASASSCHGVSDREQVAASEAHVWADSCAVDGLIDDYRLVSQTTGDVTSILKNPIGTVTTQAYGWWADWNASKLEDCAAAGTGVKWWEANGIIGSCEAQ